MVGALIVTVLFLLLVDLGDWLFGKLYYHKDDQGRG
jgi:hypothetical protein